jgi:DNA-binding response OmpR family regulator/anti-sigma regulatory factor (Ser/Thr protein kinase)
MRDRISIMIVEDSSLVSLELERRLEKLGYSVLGTAATGRDAIKAAFDRPPQLILMDIMLADDMNGIDAARIILQSINVPVIFTTAYSDEETVKLVQEVGPYGYLIKPYNDRDLAVAIETALTRFNYEKKLEESERRYRSIIEGSNDIIFTLDQDFKIVSINNAVRRYLTFKPEDCQRLHILDMIHDSAETKGFNRDMAAERLSHFSSVRKPVSFRAPFISHLNNESIEMNVNLEYISTADTVCILGRIYRISEDELLNYFVSESQRLVIGNYLIPLDEVAQRLTRNLRKYADFTTVDCIRIGLFEMLVNSIEHGNLEVSYSDKTRELSNGNYLRYISTKQSDPKYRSRSVTIDYIIDEKHVEFRICDQGEGFDYKKYLFTKQNSDANSMHGRGIQLAKNIFDEIRYNEKGNEVILIKKF